MRHPRNSNRPLTADSLLAAAPSPESWVLFAAHVCIYLLLLFLLFMLFLLFLSLLLLLATIVNPIYYKCFLPLGVEHWHLANGKNVTKTQTNKQLPWQCPRHSHDWLNRGFSSMQRLHCHYVAFITLFTNISPSAYNWYLISSKTVLLITLIFFRTCAFLYRHSSK